MFFPPLVGVVLLHPKFCSTGRGSKKINGTHFLKKNRAEAEVGGGQRQKQRGGEGGGGRAASGFTRGGFSAK